jgi:hypothetical protein
LAAPVAITYQLSAEKRGDRVADTDIFSTIAIPFMARRFSLASVRILDSCQGGLQRVRTVLVCWIEPAD